MAFLLLCGLTLLFAIVGTIWVLRLDKRDKEREQQAAHETQK